MKLKDKTILIISNEPWGDIWYSKHNWANELSKNNFVYFINPPHRWKPKDLLKTKIQIEDYKPSLKILNYNNRLPFTRFNLLFKLNESFIYKSFNKYFSDKNNIIFWTFDPYRLIYPQKLNILMSIYFIADRYKIKREQELIKKSDYIFAVSKELTKDINHNKILNLSHGISDTQFLPDKNIDYQDYILYIGNIDHRLDYELIEQLLIKFPKNNFLFIGKLLNQNIDVFDRLFLQKKYKNFIHIPAIHFNELKNYIAKSIICLAPMKLDVYGNGINHHKLLQYLALGKPVLSAKFSDYNDNELLIEYSNIDEAVNKLKENIENKETAEIKNKRINFAKQFLYSNLIKKIEDFL